MGNLFDYLTWRGDLSTEQSPFNAVDNLVLSALAYVPFDGIVPSQPGTKGITVAGAADLFAASPELHRALRAEEDGRLLAAVARAPRFAAMRLSGYVNQLDDGVEKQFAAITVETLDGAWFVAFRGTDLHLVGWKEDFNLSYLDEIPSQRDARDYLELVARRVWGKLRLGGHSKGGNLAVFAAAFCRPSVQKRVLAAYSNDGPGFETSVIAKRGYQNLGDRIKSYIPESSIVGMMLEHSDDFTVVESTQTGIMQHSPFTWVIEGPAFVTRDTVSESSLFIDRTLKDWLASMDRAQRERFCEALYEILRATKAQTVTELTVDWLKTAKAMSQTLKSTDAETKRMLQKTVALLFRSARRNLPIVLPKLPRE
jgi:hypothetical protein